MANENLNNFYIYLDNLWAKLTDMGLYDNKYPQKHARARAETLLNEAKEYMGEEAKKPYMVDLFLDNRFKDEHMILLTDGREDLDWCVMENLFYPFTELLLVSPKVCEAGIRDIQRVHSFFKHLHFDDLISNIFNMCSEYNADNNISDEEIWEKLQIHRIVKEYVDYKLSEDSKFLEKVHDGCHPKHNKGRAAYWSAAKEWPNLYDMFWRSVTSTLPVPLLATLPI